MDSSQRDRFELLSAYLDGEVTPTERQQVQHWLNSDPKTQQLYARLLKLHRGIVHLPTPEPDPPIEELQARVFAACRRRQLRRVAVVGGSAIAALVIGGVFGVLPGTKSPLRYAQSQFQQEVPTEDLALVLHRPAIEIPDALNSPSETLPSSTPKQPSKKP